VSSTAQGTPSNGQPYSPEGHPRTRKACALSHHASSHSSPLAAFSKSFPPELRKGCEVFSRSFSPLCLAPAHAQPDTDSLSFIKAIYQTYKGTEGGLPYMYSRRLQALVDKDTKGDAGRLCRLDRLGRLLRQRPGTQPTELKIVLISKSATTTHAPTAK
jgi:hypothetical protein